MATPWSTACCLYDNEPGSGLTVMTPCLTVGRHRDKRDEDGYTVNNMNKVYGLINNYLGYR